MKDFIDEKKRIGLIVAYYLSRCNKEAIKELGYENFNKAYNDLANLLDDKPTNIKNMRDEFDPYFDNGRKGWYQRKLSLSRQLIYNEFDNYSNEELTLYVKKLIENEKQKISENNILEDLGILIRSSTIHYNQNFVWKDVELTEEFKKAYEEYLKKIKWDIEYCEATSVITSSSTKKIFVPNQWFVIASYAVGVYSELNKYKKYFESVSDTIGYKRDIYARQLRDNPLKLNKEVFIRTAQDIFSMKYSNSISVKKATNRLWRFVTDYSWWSGHKTVDRTDFYLSVVLNMLNLVNASQGYVGEIVNAYGTDKYLKHLTKKLEYFTKNMQGSTYDVFFNEEKTVVKKELEYEKLPKVDTKPYKHKIKISKSSIEKMGGSI